MSAKIKILYVDDEPLNLQLFEINFSQKYEVFTAPNGFKALDILEKESAITIVISDMKMPGMNGLEFINKAREKFPEKKYYILTGFDITDEIQKSIEAGIIIKYFRKPFNMNEIETAMSDALKNQP